MNNQQFEEYLETMQQQLMTLRQALSSYRTMEADLPLIAQLHLQGYISDQTRIRLELIIGSIITQLILSQAVIEDIEVHFEHERKERESKVS